ncbi:glycosyltransferase family 2 protein [Micromonospora sp. DT43]|uniref:glycosyltransferase family 2 protein n=1 Tax=Micromonospora sp. DT43 TaxID=3393440 RepID=UPI003CEE99DB
MPTSHEGEPLISVIMPAFNVERVLPDAIESVLDQSLRDLELIIVDDASTDGTARVAEHYRALDNRVRVVTNTTNSRRGIIQWEPRNNGLQVARGTLIAYLDADNRWEPPTLATLAQVLVERPDAQLVYCRSRNHHHPDQLDQVIAADSRTAVQRGPGWVVFAQDELVPESLGLSQYVDTNEMMHRASVFRALGSLWHTVHPRRAWVNEHQGRRCPYRRHNDLDLAERIIRAYGRESVVQVPAVLVNFYYPSAARTPTATSWPTSAAALLDEGAR